MKEYSEIKLDENQKEFLQMLLDSGYTTLKQDEGFGLMATGVTDDEHKFLLLSGIVEPNSFDWVKEDEPCEIAKLLNKPYEPETVWDLKEGDVFWAINSRGHVYRDTWSGGDFDVECRNQGNVFLTEKEAEFEYKRREVVAKVRKYTRPFALNEENYYPYYNNGICVDFDGRSQLSLYYFASKKDIADAVDEVGKDDFKKYYLGVTE